MSRRGLAAVVLLQLAALLTICLLVGDNGWDDGTITLAFARTFARHGAIALTSHSEVVEGFSSVSWWLLNAAAALARPSFGSAILVSQLLSALSICAVTLLLARTCALLTLDRRFSTATVIAFAVWGCSFSEASNGMEMGLLAVALGMMVNQLLSPRPCPVWLGLGAVLAVTTRFEAVLYVAALAVVLAALREWRSFRVLAIASTVAVLLLTGWRLSVFSDWMPNTVWAKRWPPYAGLGLVGRLKGALELPLFFAAPMVLLAFARLSGRPLPRLLPARRRALWVLGAPLLAVVLMGILTGEHWGYLGRMPYCGFPLGLALSAVLLSSWVNARACGSRWAAVGVVGIATTGLSMLAFPVGSLAAALHGECFGVTPRTYAESGRTFKQLAAAAGVAHASILTPDMGGLALACDEFRLVDLGMLANATLAHRGPAAIGDVLARESPEIVEAHWQWASAGKLYEQPYFQARYTPAFAGGMKLWIRRDVADTIQRSGRACWLPVGNEKLQEAIRGHRYADHDLPADRAAFVRSGQVLVMREVHLAGNGLCD